MSLTVRQPFSLVMPMTEEWLLTLGAHKMLKRTKKNQKQRQETQSTAFRFYVMRKCVVNL